MRLPLLAIVLAGSLLGAGCVCRGFPVETHRDTPELAFETFRTSLRAGYANVVYESFSERFKEKYGVPDLRTFEAGFKLYSGDVENLSAALEKAEVEKVEYRRVKGRDYAFLTLRSEDSEGQFVLVDQPGWSVLVEVEGYDPEREEHFVGSFEDVIRVEDGKISVPPLPVDLAPEASEVKRFAVYHQWLLHDIVRLENVPILDWIRDSSKSDP